MATTTPLRYPGGKSVMTSFFREFIITNNLHNVIYAEPYAGGAGSALNLLLEGSVENIIINDANIAIYSFWKSLVEYGDEFLALLESTPINISEWKRQRKIFLEKNDKYSLELGFATFYLNRCNRSGILKAGAIGGNSSEKQKKANYKIDARFNKVLLKKRLERIIKYSNRIAVMNLDAVAFLKQCMEALPMDHKERLLIYLDPPYYVHGSELYMNFYTHEDHVTLSKTLREVEIIKWVLSYDNVEQIRDMYNGFNLYTFDLKYTVQTAKIGKELLTHSQNSILPPTLEIPRPSGAIPLLSIP